MNATFISRRPSVIEISMENIVPAQDISLLQYEIEGLLRDHVILRTAPYTLFVCRLQGLPALRYELGRMREITFRRAGESTGKSIDTDGYDDYYEQLIIWDTSANKLVGGYRFGCGDKIYPAMGKKGFYMHSFFSIDNEFDAYLPACLELGRSFIIDEYQKKNLPLYLLWKGILAYQSTHPQYKYLIGPVSISRYYSDFSRKLLMEYAMRHLSHPVFTQWFHPRTPYDPVLHMDEHSGTPMDVDLKHLENIIDNIRPEHIEYPVLMKQYLRQNARFLGFNLDPDFNDALDGLMILNMEDVPAGTVELLHRSI